MKHAYMLTKIGLITSGIPDDGCETYTEPGLWHQRARESFGERIEGNKQPVSTRYVTTQQGRQRIDSRYR